MPFTASFTAIQQKGGAIVVTDTSVYSTPKTSFSNRKISLYKSDGSVTVIPFTYAAYPLDNISFTLERDYCLRVVFEVTPIVPQSPDRYSAYTLQAFNQMTIDYLINIAQLGSLSSKYSIGGNFYKSICNLFVNNESATFSANALRQIEAQSCLNRNYQIMNQQIVL
jgi:hypothetical protein